MQKHKFHAVVFTVANLPMLLAAAVVIGSALTLHGAARRVGLAN